MKLKKFPSIAKKLQTSYIIIIALMIILPAITIISSIIQTSIYDRMITNVSKANTLIQIIKTDLPNTMWDIVAGNTKYYNARQFNIIKNFRDELNKIIETTSSIENIQLLMVTDRTIKTLLDYIVILGDQIEQHASVEENEIILEEIRGVSSLIADILQDFVVLEIEFTSRTNEKIKSISWMLAALQIFVLFFVTIFAIYAQGSVTRSINTPIRELENLSTSIASGNIKARASIPSVMELNNLTNNLNVMAERIQELLDKNIQEQKNMQKYEMKALQAQITPHFLYNTFDTIIWLAEAKKTEEVIYITRAFSNFFRISISRGQEWISVKEEIEHIKSYLIIQKIRYRDILDYSITIDQNILNFNILKLLLQPIVENALYHGIKNKRGKGCITIEGNMIHNKIVITIADNGRGIEPERLQTINEQMYSGPETSKLSDVYGLFNVARRLRLYYSDQAKFTIVSELNIGTTVTFSLPGVVNEI